MTIEELKQKCIDIIGADYKSLNVRLYFITKKFKDGVKSYHKVLDKYKFEMHSVQLEDQISAFLIDTVKIQVNKTLANTDIEVKDYEIIDDDADDALYSYSANNRNIFQTSIAKILNDQINIPPIQCLAEIKENIFAYCVKISNNDDEVFYSFRRINTGAFVTTSSQNIMDYISASFDSNDGTLKILSRNSVKLDNKVDCVYIDETFFIIQKKSFEAILGLEEEYKENANKMINVLEENNSICQLPNELRQMMAEARGLIKTMAAVAKKNTHHDLNKKDIDKLSKLQKKMTGNTLKMEDSKVKLETLRDLTDFVKLLNDFYKQGLFTEKYYGSNSGRPVTPKG